MHTTVSFQRKSSKWSQFFLLMKPILHVIGEIKSKYYTFTLKTGRTNFTKSLIQIGVSSQKTICYAKKLLGMLNGLPL